MLIACVPAFATAGFAEYVWFWLVVVVLEPFDPRMYIGFLDRLTLPQIIPIRFI